MIGRCTLAFLALALAPAAAAQTQPGPRPSAEGQPPARAVMYACPGGTDFSAEFSSDGDLAVLSVPGQPEIELSRDVSGSGFAYSDSYYQLRGRGREATLTAAGRSMRCHAVGRPGEPPRTYSGGGLTVTLLPDGTFRLRDDTPGASPALDLGQWSQEVEGGVRLVLRGSGPSRSFREAPDDRLIGQDGKELARTPKVDPIDARFRMNGLYRDTQNGGVFSECRTGRSYPVAPRAAEAALEQAWTEATPSKETALYVEILGRFVDGEVEADEFIALDRHGSCPPPAPRGAALRGTEWRVVEIDGQRPVFDNWRERPTLTLDEDGRYAASTGCNLVSGTYQLDTEGLRFAAPAPGAKSCDSRQSDIQRAFLQALAAVTRAQVAGTTLDLTDGAGKRHLRLDARGR
jgi:heat shock protein HslJ/membrane-bound inhibitor of C-type lysozyme